MSDRELMRAALEEAQKTLPENGGAGDVPVGAVVMREGAIIARAHNMREEMGDPTAHAEILALRGAARALGDWRLSGCTMAVTLEPCPMCAAAIRSARIQRLVYGARDAAYGACGSALDLLAGPGPGPAIPVEGGLEGDACARLIEDFFRRRR